jgi:hypothetical protein
VETTPAQQEPPVESPVESISIVTTPTADDWHALVAAVKRRAPQRRPKQYLGLAVVMGLVVSVGLVSLSDVPQAPLQLLFGILIGVIGFVVVAWLIARFSRPAAPNEFRAGYGYELGPEDIVVSLSGSTWRMKWSAVQAISATADQLFIWLDPSRAFIVPFRDLPQGTERAELIRRIEGWTGRTVASDDDPGLTGGGSVTQTAPGSLRAATAGLPTDPRWAATLLRLLLLRKTSDAPARASAGLLTVLAILACVVWIGVDWLGNQPEPEFFIYGVSQFGWYALVAFAIATVLARRSWPAIEWSRTLAVVLAAAPVFAVARYAIEWFLSSPWTVVVSLLLLCYFIVYGARSLRALTGRTQAPALVAAIVVALGLLWLTDRLYVDPGVWLASTDEDDADYESSRGDAETLLFSQSARIDAAVDAVAPASDAAPAVFFVGFAGFAGQRVFAEEIKLAARVVGERYGSQQREVFLVNDRRSREAQPLASPTGLHYALRRLATKMNTERDILFLALSSHGSEDSLSVSNGGLMLQDLTADDLASALEDSGIKWRVIVISACHAGSFINELRTPNTIVIAAAAADKTSFGCSDDRDLTYFGEAFYRDALPTAKSLRDAFGKAKSAIGAREKRENVTASSPQAFFSAEAERYLATYEQGMPSRSP